ncbi:MAG: NAD(P)/FAD-dependent oxidoreductase [Dinoroseobacter sp.]|nr:NAD(P)/FAD-dependent oxidoreductase [Dinoroseobacter sp.]
MDVVVIGAGLSGLTAATVLREVGAEVLVIDADRQIGGRIRAFRDRETNEALADLGPTWIWPKHQPIVANWLKRLGLETFSQFNGGDAVILGYGPAPFRQPLPGQDGIARLVGGPTAFIEALASRLDPGTIRTASPAIGIHEEGSGRIGVHLGSGEVLSAQRVIISMPLRVAAATVDMPWAPPELANVMRRTPTWMSTHAKAIALYDRPFWRDAGLSGRIASRTGTLVEAHDHSGQSGAPAAIFGFVGWPPEIRKRDPEGLRHAILNQLTECFGPAAAHPTNLMVQDWATNPNIVSDVDLSQPADHPDVGPAILRQAHLGGRIRFAVSEVSGVSPGLIEGALAAGEQAAMRHLDLID